MAEITERGVLLFVLCPQDAGGRFAIVLKPAGTAGFRRLVVRERTPGSPRGLPARVDRVAKGAADPLGTEARPAGEGFYVLVRRGGETHLIYAARLDAGVDLPVAEGATFRLAVETRDGGALDALDREGAALLLVA